MLKLIRVFRIRYLREMANFITPVFIYIDKVPNYSEKAWDKKRKYLRKLGFDIAEGVGIDSGFEFIRHEGIRIGEWTSIGKNFKCYNYNDVNIGKFCLFAGEVQINNGGHHKDNYLPFSGVITIEDGVWIGHGVRIIGTDICIGKNSILGAGSLILESVPENSIAIGSPARVVGKRDIPRKVWHVDNKWYDPNTFTILPDV